MTYRLLGSLTSPFVRRIRLYMASIPHEFEIVNWAESDQDARLTLVSPLKRIPVLLIDGQPLWESRIIFQYLQRKHEKTALSRRREHRERDRYAARSTDPTVFDAALRTCSRQRKWIL